VGRSKAAPAIIEAAASSHFSRIGRGVDDQGADRRPEQQAREEVGALLRGVEDSEPRDAEDGGRYQGGGADDPMPHRREEGKRTRMQCRHPKAQRDE